MEINAVTPANSLQVVLQALAELADPQPVAAPGEGPAGAPAGTDLHSLSVAHGAGHDVEHGSKTVTAESDAVHPDARLDRGAESALVQSFARPDLPAPKDARLDVRHLATPALAGSEFSLPADQLLNVAVIGLQVEHSFPWQLQRHGVDTIPEQVPAPHAEAPAAKPARSEEPRHVADHDGDPSHDDGAGEGIAHDEAEAHAPATLPGPPVPVDDPADDWPEPLSRALREALRARPVPQALLAAAEQWRIGRCVVLACPQGPDPAGAAWAFVLWPRPGSHAAPLALFGLRVDARLHWSRLPPTLDWCHARVMKEQHPRHGRQLIALDARGTAAVPCEVQLGPVPLRTPRWRDACVRIDAVRRFWSALGQQWSMTVVVGSRPLAGLRASGAMEAAWET